MSFSVLFEKSRLFLFLFTIIVICITISCSANTKSTYNKLVAEGDVLFLEKRYFEAIQAWKKALALNSHAIDLYYKAGFAYVRLEDYLKAESLFYKIIEIKPNDWNAWVQIGHIHLITGDVATAKEIWDKIPIINKKETDASIFYGDLLFLQRKYGEAEIVYQKIADFDGSNQEVLIKLALCMFAENLSEKADGLFFKLEALKPCEVKILVQMAKYCRFSGRLQRAEKYYLEALRADPSDVSSSIGLADLYISCSQKKKALEVLQPVISRNEISDYTKKLLVEMMLSIEQFREAGRILDELYIKNNDDIEVLMLKGNYYLLLHEPVMAIEFYQSVIAVRPGNAQALYWLGVSYLLSGHEQLGLQSLISALSINSNFSEAELAIADFYYKKQRYHLSEEYVQRVISRENDSFRGYMILGSIYLAQKHYADAEKMFKKAESLAPNKLTARYYKAKAIELDGRMEEAIALYSGILNQDSTLADVNKSYAFLLTKIQGVQEAIKFLEKSAIKMPENGYIQLILGKIYLVAGKKKEATDAYRLAIERDPELCSAYLELFDIFAKDMDIEKQKEILELAITNIPDFSDAYTRLGLLYISEHREQEAVQLLEKGYELSNKNPYLANNLSSVYLDLNINPIRAYELAQSAYKKMPDKPAFSDTLGWAYCKRGIYRMALWHFNDALKQLEKYAKDNFKTDNDIDTFYKTGENNRLAIATVMYHQGVTLFKIGEKKKAAVSIEEALRIGLRKSDKDTADKLLEQIFVTEQDE